LIFTEKLMFFPLLPANLQPTIQAQNFFYLKSSILLRWFSCSATTVVCVLCVTGSERDEIYFSIIDRSLIPYITHPVNVCIICALQNVVHCRKINVRASIKQRHMLLKIVDLFRLCGIHHERERKTDRERERERERRRDREREKLFSFSICFHSKYKILSPSK
jgi:hypothetical protein